ncbi:sugar ABC transporter permease, partial [Agrobacterium fabacearum]|nr:sugar ABC transporter permease [Agrobacterium tumefaciens]
MPGSEPWGRKPRAARRPLSLSNQNWNEPVLPDMPGAFRDARAHGEVSAMATRNTSGLARVMLAPSVLLLLVWMIVPLAMTL